MDMWKLWHTFQSSGRVEDYLRYRGIDLAAMSACVREEATTDGNGTKTTSDDRRPDIT
ncbi:MAG: hypothetical protein IJO76_07815 [Clostridia bacterium]|nr:hypothetical protein [Clostridia bacterium]